MERYFQWVVFPSLVIVVAIKFLAENAPAQTWQGAYLKKEISANALKRLIPRQEVSLLTRDYSWKVFLSEVAHEVSLSVKDLQSLRQLPDLTKGTKVVKEKSRGAVKKISVYHPLGYIVEFEQLAAKWQLTKDVPQIENKEKIISGVVTNSLAETLAENGVTKELVTDIQRAIKQDSSQVKKGDSYVVLLTEKLQGKNLLNQTLKAVYVNSLKGEIFAARLSEKSRFYGLQDINQVSGAWLSAPVRYKKISSEFSYSRFHPILKFSRPHPAVDLAAPYGTPVKSVADGVVIHAGWLSTNGNTVIIRHKGGIETIYRHLSRVDVKYGQKLNAGTIIGSVGSTGLSTGPHLCFSVKVNGKYVDPLRFRPNWTSVALDSKFKLELQKTLNKLRDFNRRFLLAQSRLTKGS